LQLTVSLLSNIEGIMRIKDRWDSFISKQTESPFLLTSFINQWLDHNIEELKPFFMVFLVQDEIVGIAPLGIRDFGFRYCRLLLGKDWQPELIFDSHYKEVCFKKTFDVLFGKMNCQFIDLFIPVGHPDLQVLIQICEELGIHHSVSPETGRAILPVNCSWWQFIQKKRKLRREIERTERRLKEIGQLRIRWFEKTAENELFKSILAVENASWKESYRSRIGLKADPVLSFLFYGCLQTSLTVSEFEWGIALLELNEKPIAYSLFVNHRGHAYVCKTSFDDRYRRQGAGIYINHMVVHELLSRNVSVIDFMTDLPFSHKWASEVTQVKRFKLWQRGVAPFLFRNVLSSRVAQIAINDLGKISGFINLLINQVFK